MKCACRERVDGNLNWLAYLYGTDNRIGHADDDLYGVGFGERECGDARSDKRAELDGFLHDVAVEGRNQRGVAQSDFRLARKSTSRFQLLLTGIVLRASGIEVRLGNALSVIQVRSPIEIEFGFLCDSFGGSCLRGCLVYLVLVFRRSDADEYGSMTDSIPFRNITHPAILAARLLERNDVSGNSECQENFRIGRHYRRETQAVGAEAHLLLNGLTLDSLWGLIEWLIRATADHDEHQ